MRSIGIRIGIIAVIVIGAIVLRPFLSGNAGGLQVGDCFDPPTGGGTIDDVQHRPCTEPHGGEVVFVGKYEPSTDTYPTDDEFSTFYEPKCIDAFESFTGLDWDTAEEYSMDTYTPTSESWADGSRKIICYLIAADGTQLSKSLKKQ